MTRLDDFSANELIDYLKLEPHPAEEGYFRRTYVAPGSCRTASGQERATMSSIFYLLTRQMPEGVWHRNRSDILHYYQGGGILRYEVLSPEGVAQCFELGPDLAAGHQLQLLVPGGSWKRSALIQGDWGLVSEAVTPGFDFADNDIADAEQVKTIVESIQVSQDFVR